MLLRAGNQRVLSSVRDIKIPSVLPGKSASESRVQSGRISVKRQGWNQVTGLTEKEHIENMSKSFYELKKLYRSSCTSAGSSWPTSAYSQLGFLI